MSTDLEVRIGEEIREALASRPEGATPETWLALVGTRESANGESFLTEVREIIFDLLMSDDAVVEELKGLNDNVTQQLVDSAERRRAQPHFPGTYALADPLLRHPSEADVRCNRHTMLALQPEESVQSALRLKARLRELIDEQLAFLRFGEEAEELRNSTDRDPNLTIVERPAVDPGARVEFLTADRKVIDIENTQGKGRLIKFEGALKRWATERARGIKGEFNHRGSYPIKPRANVHRVNVYIPSIDESEARVISIQIDEKTSLSALIRELEVLA